MVLGVQTRSYLHPPNLMPADLGKTLHFPSVLHTSHWAGCPTISPAQLNHAASAIPRGPCPCPPALPSLVCDHGANLTSTTLEHMHWASAALQPCASPRIPHMLLTFLPADTTLQAWVSPVGGPWNHLLLGGVGSDRERHRDS